MIINSLTNINVYWNCHGGDRMKDIVYFHTIIEFCLIIVHLSDGQTLRFNEMGYFFIEQFSKMKDEVPPALVDAHIKTVEEAAKDGKDVDENYGLEKSGIAGTAPEKEEGLYSGLRRKKLYIEDHWLVSEKEISCNKVVTRKIDKKYEIYIGLFHKKGGLVAECPFY